MARFLVVFASLNQVALLKRSLYRRGVFVEMQRTPHCLSTTGCGFALRCKHSELQLLGEECRRLKTSPGGIFEETLQDETLHYHPLNASEFGR
jgi:hypothetical protein